MGTCHSYRHAWAALPGSVRCERSLRHGATGCVSAKTDHCLGLPQATEALAELSASAPEPLCTSQIPDEHRLNQQRQGE